MKKIPLTQGQFALVDDQDYERISQHKWQAGWNHTVNRFYARRSDSMKDGKRGVIWMHREVLGLSPDDPRKGDHISSLDTLDNRQSNLRIASISQNNCNTVTYKNNTSGHKGVSLYQNRVWRAYINIHGSRIYLGQFPTKEKAIAARVEAALVYHGQFARHS